MNLIALTSATAFNKHFAYRHLLVHFIFCGLLLALFASARAQETSPAPFSKLTSARLAPHAERIALTHVPAAVSEVLKSLIAAGGNGIRQGDTEVLVWTKNYKKAQAPAIIRQLGTGIQTAGWTLEPGGEADGITVFSVSRNTPKKQVLIGFYKFSDKALVWACTEMLAANEPAVQNQTPRQSGNNTTLAAAKIVTVNKDTKLVNVMDNQMPAMPAFPKLQPKAGKVCGYVKDCTGKPLAGASIGIRSSYFAGYYSGGKGKTDANGYYELTPPKGSAHFYNAGYPVQYGEGVAAVSLHPADGILDSWTTTDGIVENFVLLPYGITSRENVQNNPQLPSSYYGGAIFLSWYGVEADDTNAPEFAIKEGTLVEISLTPQGNMISGTAPQSIIIRKTAAAYGELRIHNIPLGQYNIRITANGKPVGIKDTRKQNPGFGLSPAEAVGTANIAFLPVNADPSMIAPQYGAWDWVSLNLEMISK
jgi:hypothetical protein